MYSVYKITNSINNKVYYGITKNSLKSRFNGHKHKAKTSKLPFGRDVKKYGIDKFKIELIASCATGELAGFIEIALIKTYGCNYNVHKGGEIGNFLPEGERKEAWRTKLKLARVGRKPALGMKHSEENKKLFSKVSNEYWDSQEKYNSEKVLSVGFSESNKLYGISKTHYYRLRKRALEEATSVE